MDKQLHELISKSKLQWMLLVRVILVTTLLGSAITVQIVYPDAPSYRALYFFIGITYIVTIFYGIFYKLLSSTYLYIYMQLITDTIMITLLIYFSGGTESRFTMLLTLPIIAAAIILDRRGATMIVVTAFLLYGIMVNLLYYGILPNPSDVDLNKVPIKNFFYDLFFNLVLFLITALLVGYLAENLRKTGKTLESTSVKLDDLKVFNKNVIDAMSAGLMTTDLSGYLISYNNLARIYAKNLGKNLDGEKISSFLDLSDKELKSVREGVLINGKYTIEKDYVNKNGNEITLSFNITQLPNSKGEIIGFIFSFQDITDLRKLENELKIKEKMAALGSMAAAIAHEIRNPLASISGSAQELRSRSGLSELEKTMMEIIIKETKRLNNILINYLEFAKPLRFNPLKMELNKALEDTILLVQRNPNFLENKHKIEINKLKSRRSFAGDVDSLKQVFWNLIINALQAMREGGILLIDISENPEDNMVIIKFTDNGTGIPKHIRTSIFEPFKSYSKDGFGLGLSIVYRIINEHSGKILIKDNRPKGTILEVHLPYIKYHRLKKRILSNVNKRQYQNINR